MTHRWKTHSASRRSADGSPEPFTEAADAHLPPRLDRIVPASPVDGEATMLSGFKKFLLRGNIVDLAIGVAIGAAFNALVGAFGNAFIKPLLGLALGGGIQGGAFEVHGQVFDVGGFINAAIVFLITAAVLYFFVVAPLNALTTRLKKEPEPDAPTRECPECLNRIPAGAHRCMYCTSEFAQPR